MYIILRKSVQITIHSRKLTWNLKMMVSNRKLLFQVSIFGCHVSFRGCNSVVQTINFHYPKVGRKECRNLPWTLIWPAIKPLFLRGGTLGGDRLRSHETKHTTLKFNIDIQNDAIFERGYIRANPSYFGYLWEISGYKIV